MSFATGETCMYCGKWIEDDEPAEYHHLADGTIDGWHKRCAEQHKSARKLREILSDALKKTNAKGGTKKCSLCGGLGYEVETIELDRPHSPNTGPWANRKLNDTCRQCRGTGEVNNGTQANRSILT